KGAGEAAVALDLAGVANIDNDDVVVADQLARIGRADGFDLGIGLVDHRLDAAVDLLHRILQTFDRDRIHAICEQPADDGGGFRIVPVPLCHRIEPHRVRIGAGYALHPDRAGLLVDMLDRAARHHDLVGAHRGVADEHDLIVVGVFVQDVP
ncbi:hypothetical protein KXV85_004652, partial [Aspergillus fumigatus]